MFYGHICNGQSLNFYLLQSRQAMRMEDSIMFDIRNFDLSNVARLVIKKNLLCYLTFASPFFNSNQQKIVKYKNKTHMTARRWIEQDGN